MVSLVKYRGGMPRGDKKRGQRAPARTKHRKRMDRQRRRKRNSSPTSDEEVLPIAEREYRDSPSGNILPENPARPIHGNLSPDPIEEELSPDPPEEELSPDSPEEELLSQSTLIRTHPTQIEPRLNLLRTRQVQQPDLPIDPSRVPSREIVPYVPSPSRRIGRYVYPGPSIDSPSGKLSKRRRRRSSFSDDSYSDQSSQGSSSSDDSYSDQSSQGSSSSIGRRYRLTKGRRRTRGRRSSSSDDSYSNQSSQESSSIRRRRRTRRKRRPYSSDDSYSDQSSRESSSIRGRRRTRRKRRRSSNPGNSPRTPTRRRSSSTNNPYNPSASTGKKDKAWYQKLYQFFKTTNDDKGYTSGVSGKPYTSKDDSATLLHAPHSDMA